ncbi:hypothetical protein CCUS01_01521 [Colletotrichum cuscutae]|uniref:Uncharacterized protein n=1 Tax=Colletotrichum cuscutae TaxID=1209917 RepID=A0AAI9XSB2_9PEZI|nr:hypothetical protein CCUS01_01521 [Colletotrichum cuscutae]
MPCFGCFDLPAGRLDIALLRKLELWTATPRRPRSQKQFLSSGNTALRTPNIYGRKPRSDRNREDKMILGLVVFCGYTLPGGIDLWMAQSLVGQLLRLCGPICFAKDETLLTRGRSESSTDYCSNVVNEYNVEIFESFILGKLMTLFKEQTDLAKNQKKAPFLIVVTDPSKFGDFRISEAAKKLGLGVKALSYFETTNSGASLDITTILTRGSNGRRERSHSVGELQVAIPSRIVYLALLHFSTYILKRPRSLSYIYHLKVYVGLVS